MDKTLLESVFLKAMDKLKDGITISDALLDDHPLVYVNGGFTQMTGYSERECLHRNCRFLQGPETDPATVALIHKALQKQEPLQLELLNYRKDGTTFWNFLSLTPLFDTAGALTHYIGIQEDVTAQRESVRRVSEMERQRLLREATLDAQEKERHEIGKELHDNVSQVIATLRLYLDAATKYPDSREALVEQARGLSDKLLQEVRRVSHQFVGPLFGEDTLALAFENLVAGVRAAAPFRLELVQDAGVEAGMSDRRKLVFYRVAQEQLNNVLKHARATRVRVSFGRRGERAVLTVSDNGVGFDPRAKARGIGFRNMGDRVALEDGSLEVETAAGEGCKVVVSLPY